MPNKNFNLENRLFIRRSISKFTLCFTHYRNLLYASIVIASLLIFTTNIKAQTGTESYVSFGYQKGFFSLSTQKKAAPIYASSTDFKGVLRAIGDLQTDIKKVTTAQPEIRYDQKFAAKEIIIIGTLGKNPLIDQLAKEKKIDTSAISGKWETFLIQTVENPIKGVSRALVILGSDKRGTIFGIYDLSQKIGVSPWYWWNDVPVEHRDAVYVKPVKDTQSPSVKYRGIFLNDEHPNLTRWVNAKYGMVKPGTNPPIPNDIANYNSEFYKRIFEVLLRLKANYLWPAMWNNAFNEDDPLNPVLADEYGIVMGTSHQEPMQRAQKEWDRRYIKKLGTWNYSKYPDTLENFWREGIRRNKNYDNLVTIGLRGANDTEMAPGGPEANMSLLEKIVERQRKIFAEEVNTDVTKVPQVWCLYKEVLDYFKAGMRVPDDVILLWAEDNWGNVRRLPSDEERKRPGGAGIYYHFDYHGGPRSYQWTNTNPVPKIWDQMSLAKQYGADKVWIVNVGHFKAYAIPMEYFLGLAWDTKKWTGENIREFTRAWSERQFGPEYATEIADIITKYTKYNGRRKTESLSPTTYSLINYREAETVVADFKAITAKAEEIFKKLPKEKQDAFYQLVLFPTKASCIVNELYLAAGKNMLYAKQRRAATNDKQTETNALFKADTSLMGYFNRDFMGGKWSHFQDQTHLGYTSWNDPPVNSLRAIKLSNITVPDSAIMGVSVEESESVWPGEPKEAALPQFNRFSQKMHYFEIFNKGSIPFNYSVSADQSWIKLSKTTGSLEKEERIWVNIDWKNVPNGLSAGTIAIKGTNAAVSIKINAFNPQEISKASLQGFIEENGYVSIEAEHYANKTREGSRYWSKIEDYGHTLSAMRANSDTNAEKAVPGENAPCLEYKMYLFTTDTITVTGIFSPTLNFIPGRSLQYAVSFDNEKPQIVTLVPAKFDAANGNRDWELSVLNNARFSKSSHLITTPGYHTLKIWMVDQGVVLQKLLIDLGGLKPSYLGAPESFYNFK
jgi:hypothetical protein